MRGHTGQGWNTVEVVLIGPYSGKVLVARAVLSVFRVVAPVAAGKVPEGTIDLNKRGALELVVMTLDVVELRNV